MKKLLGVLLVSLLLFGCMQQPGPSTAASPTPILTPTPTPTPAPVAAQIIEQAGTAVPLSAGFLSSLTGVKQSSPESYTLASEGSAEFSIGLKELGRLDFASAGFKDVLARVATAKSFTKTIMYSPSLLSVEWSSLSNGAVKESVSAKLAKEGASEACVYPEGAQKQCVAASKETADALWSALQTNALEEFIAAFYPDASLKDFIKLENAKKTETIAERSCNAYSFGLTPKGIDELNSLGAGSITNLQGSLCIDLEYGFPLSFKVESEALRYSEQVKAFKETASTPTATPKPEATLEATPTISPAPSATPTISPTPIAALEAPTGDVALVVFDSASLSAEEQAVKTLLESYGKKVTPISAEGATFDAIKAFGTIAATDYHEELAKETVDALLEGGRNVLLLHGAIGTTNGAKPESTKMHSMRFILHTGAFLSKYGLTQKTVPVQSDGDSFFVKDYTSWDALLEVPVDENDKVCCNSRTIAFSRTTSKGGRGAALGYDPSALAGEGKVLLDEVARWVLDVRTPSVTIDDGKVALIASGYDDAASLSPQDEALKKALEENGLGVQVISQLKRFSADYSKAKGIATAYGPGFGMQPFYTPLMSQKPLLLAYSGFTLIDGAKPYEFGTATVASVGGDKRPLVNYDGLSQNEIRVTNGGKMFVRLYTNSAELRNPYGGWYSATFIVGSLPSEDIQYMSYFSSSSVLFNETADARNIMFSYDPSQLTNEGKILFKEAIRWMFKITAPELTVPEGNVALLVASFDDAAKLTADEAATKSLVESMNKRVTVVPQKYRFTANYKGAQFIVVSEYPGTRLAGFFTGMGDQAPRVALVGAGTKTIMGPNDMTSYSNDKSFKVLDNVGFFSKMDKDTYFSSVSSGKVYGVEASRNLDYSIKGVDKSSWQTNGGGACKYGCNINTAGYKAASGNKCVALLGYAPSGVNGNGNTLLYKAFGFVEDCKAK